MEEKTYTKEQLIKAMYQYGTNVINNRDAFEANIDTLESMTMEIAEQQINYLISLIPA